jgi:hypothetical protein
MNSNISSILPRIWRNGKRDQSIFSENPETLRLTEIVHQKVPPYLRLGSFAIDATLGNGHDTWFLSEHISSPGEVHAFDIQEKAIIQAREIIHTQHLDDCIRIHHLGHENMDEVLPNEMEKNTSAILFNLGYLPGGDKSCTTLLHTTVQGLELAWHQYLSPEGILSILAYPGHPTGKEEAGGVLQWLQSVGNAQVEEYESPGPVLYLVTRIEG